MMNTIIDASDSCVGTITGQGIIRVDGSFEGSVKTKELVVIGGSGQIKGDIDSKDVIIGGKFVGKILARQKTKIEAGARVEGEIKTKILRIEDGAYFEGRCNMISS
ncbi:MAG: hypothetical protein B6244_12490 [Candidatus Cloacimonetes bacterium 4572_55]|nr:MAG: hypothetical protein B6244_12490 [Candidatus Cloacimonetes bacterium 4572_55]